MDVLIVPPGRDSLIQHEEKIMTLRVLEREEGEEEGEEEERGEKRTVNPCLGRFFLVGFFWLFKIFSSVSPYHLLWKRERVSPSLKERENFSPLHSSPESREQNFKVTNFCWFFLLKLWVSDLALIQWNERFAHHRNQRQGIFFSDDSFILRKKIVCPSSSFLPLFIHSFLPSFLSSFLILIPSWFPFRFRSSSFLHYNS